MKTCLVVDDVEVTRFTASSYLKDLGYTALEADTKQGALDLLNGRDVDVILADWHLGKESGLELISEIREKMSKDIPVIVFSGVESSEAERQAKDAGAQAFLLKPTTKEKLEECLSAL